jgi:hypothetical protein
LNSAQVDVDAKREREVDDGAGDDDGEDKT